MSSLKKILSDLIRFESITPNDAGCQNYMLSFLEALGFTCCRFDNPPVANFFAYKGKGKPSLVFAGHTDVVPVGNRQDWHSDPFILTEREGLLYGRGTADMKGSLACMLAAAERFVNNMPEAKGSLGFLITSGEEGDHFDLGTPFAMAKLKKMGILPDFCVVGEPSSEQRVGDMIKIGRRGSLSAKLTLQGKQGHVAYPHLAENPIHTIAPALKELTEIHWDQGNAHFPPTSLQITHIKAGGEASNIIPGELILHLNIRYSTEHRESTLKEAVVACFQRHGLTPAIEWRLNGEPFLTAKGRLLESMVGIIKEKTQQNPILSTSGGTSDGRFIAPYGIEVIELGPVNETIHQVNEHVSLADLEILTDLYFSLCTELLS